MLDRIRPFAIYLELGPDTNINLMKMLPTLTLSKPSTVFPLSHIMTKTNEIVL